MLTQHRSGTCRMLKVVEVQKKASGKIGIFTSIMRSTSSSKSDKGAINTETHLINVGHLEKYDHFGEGNIVVNNNVLDSFTVSLGSKVSVVSNGRVELLLISKSDVFRFATAETWALFQSKNKN